MRTATIERATKETRVSVTVDLDGTGRYDVSTGVGFFDHMMEQLARHSLIDITLRVDGDRHIDDHHSVEDAGIALGQAIRQALAQRLPQLKVVDEIKPAGVSGLYEVRVNGSEIYYTDAKGDFLIDGQIIETKTR
eukprot:gene3157-4148_t